MANPTAAMLVIGDEILSGRTRDANMHYLAGELTKHGIDLKEVRVVSDDAPAIVAAVKALSAAVTHVFTSGGIGPTHDDITADCIAEAFGVPIDVREDARALLAEHYANTGRELNAARLRMARIPDGATLIDNPVSIAPGFLLGNVHVMAGVPSVFQATRVKESGAPIDDLLRPETITAVRQRRLLEAANQINRRHRQRFADQSQLDARIKSLELAFRMQARAPGVVDLSREPAHIQRLYGLDNPSTAAFGRQCLLARRMVEHGVRYTMLIHGVQNNAYSWDDHGDVKGRMIRHTKEVDRPVAALLSDLQQRGLLEETLVVWASEMGRTPFVNGSLGGSPGREHNSWALVMWMAGGNVRGGARVGATDEFGLRAAEEQIPIRNVHATILDLMGLDDEELRYLHAGRLRQLTDVGGEVLDGVIS